MNETWPYRTPGIPDDLFARGEVPMTKEEIRVVTLAKARLAPGQVIWDIGAGTGSLAVEAARQVPGGVVYAVERGGAGIELIEKNRLLFAVGNLVVVPGEAPDALVSLPGPDRVFIGGSGGKLDSIIRLSAGRLGAGGRLVINAVTLETVGEALGLLQMYFGSVEVVQLSVAKTVCSGGRHLLKSLNPVFIISAGKDHAG
ncbi:MAG: precorrin-6Y C5,15-methyltransferase (decarboxylating) subunit CbiT [Peptococcaceae bacterium]|jgi:precorrin-6Y C5,15-methyltransferase (decarboxylating) CbiT subunit|nr:MAG: precorrin-6Y C5,15-methyltransferase (decarboxylating) subunit CbiT [Peptococcaceae bacterium]